MNAKNLLLTCALLLAAPVLRAADQNNDVSSWQFAQVPPAPTFSRPGLTNPGPVTIPQRRLNVPGRQNPPASFPAFPAPPAPAARSATPASRAAVPGVPGATTPQNTANIPGMAATPPAEARRAASETDTNDPNAAIYDFDFPSIPVEQLLDTFYAPMVNRTLLMASVGPSALPANATITLKTQHPLTKKEAIVALEAVLGMNGITIIPIGDKFAKVVTEATAGHQGDEISTNDSVTNLPVAGKFVTQIVQLKYADGDDLTKLLQEFAKGQQSSIIFIKSTQTLILRDYSENVARMLEMVKRIDVASPLQVKPEIIPIRYALAADMASALTALGASGGTSVGGSGKSGANFQTGTGTRGGNFGNNVGAIGNTGMGGFGGSGGYPGQSYGLQSESIRPMSDDMRPAGGDDQFGVMAANPVAANARSSFQRNLQSIVDKAAGQGKFTLFGETEIIADERTNSLLVFANDEDMKMIKEIIAKLDVVLPQVLIEAIIMEINLSGTRNTGISYLSQKQNIGKFSGAGGLNNLSSGASSFLTGGTNGTSTATGPAQLASLPGGFSYFANYGNDLNVVLEAVAGDSRINVLSRPRIQTSHAVPADLFIGNTVPYVTGTYNYGYGSGPSSQYTQLEVGIRLQVLPLINPDGLVEMDIQTDIEQLGPDVQIQGVGGVPTTTKRQAGAKVAVLDGQTIMLGGFISDSRTKSNSGIPWLKDIPVLGYLFRSDSMENLRTELVIMLQPKVLPTPQVAAKVAAVERNKLSGVKQAELEIREDERKRNEQIETQLRKEEEQRQKERQERIKKGEVVPQYTPGVTNIDDIPPIED